VQQASALPDDVRQPRHLEVLHDLRGLLGVLPARALLSTGGLDSRLEQEPLGDLGALPGEPRQLSGLFERGVGAAPGAARIVA
jgi:hypothetical protein